MKTFKSNTLYIIVCSSVLQILADVVSHLDVAHRTFACPQNTAKM